MYVLKSHDGDPSGLGIVARKCLKLGANMLDTSKVEGSVVFNPGRPDIHASIINGRNENYIWTTFESDRIPRSWVQELNASYQEIFVPHESVKKAFEDSGVMRGITVVPQGYARYERTKEVEVFSGGEFHLGFLGVPVARKNVERLAAVVKKINKQYKDAGTDVTIKLHLHCPWLVDPIQQMEFFDENIVLTTGHKTDEEIAEWYSGLHAYIYPSNGEGWSFTPRESMYMGIPTIISDIAVHDELVGSGYYSVIKADAKEPAYYEFLKDTCGDWAHICNDELERSIKEMVDDHDKYVGIADAGQKWIADKWSWDDSLNQIKQNIEPTKLLFCPSKGRLCGINVYSKNMMKYMSDTKYVGTYQEVEHFLRTRPITEIHVQHEYGIINDYELFDKVQNWDIEKKIITLHSVKKRHRMTKLYQELFDEVIVLNDKSLEQLPKARFMNHPTQELSDSKQLLKYTVGTFGFIHPQKGYDEVVDAVNDLNYSYLIVGKYKEKRPDIDYMYRHKIKHNPLVTHINEFVDEEDMVDYMSMCKVLVFNYKDTEQIYASGSVLEAARAQRPIIVSDADPFHPVREFCHVVPQGDAEALKEGIKKVVEDEEYAASLVAKMNKHINENLWENIND